MWDEDASYQMSTLPRVFGTLWNQIVPSASIGILMPVLLRWAVLACNSCLHFQQAVIWNKWSLCWKSVWRLTFLNVDLIYTSNKARGDGQCDPKVKATKRSEYLD